MPKLLSKEEVMDIATKMTAEYGLAPNIIIGGGYGGYSTGNYDSNMKCEIGRNISVRVYKWFPWYTRTRFMLVRHFWTENFENLLVKLQYELSEFDSRTKIAEQFREKYALQEAASILDKVLGDR